MTKALSISNVPGRNPLPERIVSRREVMDMLGISHMTLRRWEKAGRFPGRIRIGPEKGRVGWRLSQILAWLDAREAETTNSASAEAA